MAATTTQHNANRANSRHSTGPVTAPGKEAVSRNALTHGLTSTRVVLPNEDPAEYQAHANAVTARYNPATPDERALTANIAAAEWRLARAWRAHDHFLAAATDAESGQFDCPVEPAAVLAAMLLTPADERRLRLILRYLRATERAHQSAIGTLTRLQKARLANASEETPAPAEPAPPAMELAPVPEAAFPTAEEAASIVAELDYRLANHTTAPEPASPAALATTNLSRAERRARERAARKAARKAARLNNN